MSTNNNYNYTFTFSLLNVTDPNAGIQVWQSGTLTLDVTEPSNISGSISLPGFYKESIPFKGTAADSSEGTGTLVNASGSSSEAEADLALIFNYDGFLYNGSLLGGIASILDNAAQETSLYIAQGFSPQGPF
jgi:hypothetical protein